MQENEVTFNVFKAMKYPTNDDECFQVDIIDKLKVEKFKEEYSELPLKAFIVHSDTTTEANNKRRECVSYLKSTTSS